MCIPDGKLRARLDGELNAAETAEVAAHLDGCPRCRERAEAIAARAARVQSLFSGLGPGADDLRADPAAAYARLERRTSEPAPSRRLRPAWGIAFAAIAAAVLLASPPGRVFAQKILGMLRINAVVAVPIERNFLAEGKADVLQQVLAGSVVKTKEGRRVTVSNRDEASRLAGYDVRLPEMRTDSPQLAVNTPNAFQFNADSQRLQTLLSAVGRTDLDIPAQLNGAKVFVDVPAAVEARYGECPGDTCLMVAQAQSPTVVTLPELNLQQIAEFGLQLTGMTAEQAHTFSQTVDWTSTLAIPVPRDAGSYETVSVNGAKGILITGLAREVRGVKRPPSYALLWAKNGMIYSVAGFGNPGMAVPVAESLR
jgi:hypothetical protein